MVDYWFQFRVYGKFTFGPINQSCNIMSWNYSSAEHKRKYSAVLKTYWNVNRKPWDTFSLCLYGRCLWISCLGWWLFASIWHFEWIGPSACQPKTPQVLDTNNNITLRYVTLTGYISFRLCIHVKGRSTLYREILLSISWLFNFVLRLLFSQNLEIQL